VVAIGAPLGLSGTVTSGIISALDRTVEVPGEGDRSALLVSALQTDASINPGNSGGALVNCESQLVGVPTAGATVPNSGGGSIGLGFAIPVDLAKRIADEIIATGQVTHAFFGLSTLPIPPAAAEQAGLPEGLFVQAVTPGGPAAAAGLRAGDVITKIDGEPATSNIQLQELTFTKSPGDTVPIDYTKDGRSATVTVTLPFGAVVWAVGYVVLPEAGIYKPIWEYDAKTLARDLGGHLAYGAGTGAAFWLFVKLW
jgi:putative serine protease PepD